MYNPWRFRVFPAGRADAASEWVSFDLAASDAAGLSLAGGLVVFMATSRQTMDELVALALGLLLASLDLGILLTQIPAADATAWALLLAIAGALVWPRLQRFDPQKIQAWGLAVVYVALVYAAIPVFPDVWGRLREHIGPGIAHLGTIPVAGSALYMAVKAWRRARSEIALWRLPVLVLVLGLYACMLSAFGRFPAERLHLLEYGVMAVVLFRALSLHRQNPAAYAWALLLTTVIGFGDETIQWILPQRFFELKDVALNLAAGSLGLALTAIERGRAGNR